MELPNKIRPYIDILRFGHNNPPIIMLLASALDSSYYNFSTVLILAFAMFLYSSSIFITNEYIDSLDTDKFQKREKAATKTRLNKTILTLFWLLFTLPATFIFLWFGLYWQAAIIVILGNLYSLPPVRFKANFPYDVLSQFVFYAIAPYSIFFQLQGKSFSEMFTIPFLTLLLFLATAEFIHLITDYQADKAAKLNNTGVVIGPMNLLRLSKTLLITSALGVGYLIYKNTHYWYYPIILVAPYVGWSLGRLRETVFRNKFNPKSIDNPILTTYTRGVRLGNYMAIFLLIVIYYLSNQQ